MRSLLNTRRERSTRLEQIGPCIYVIQGGGLLRAEQIVRRNMLRAKISFGNNRLICNFRRMLGFFVFWRDLYDRG